MRTAHLSPDLPYHQITLPTCRQTSCHRNFRFTGAVDVMISRSSSGCFPAPYKVTGSANGSRAGKPESELTRKMDILHASRSTGAEPGWTRAGLAALINPLSFRMSLRDRAARTIERIRAGHGAVFEVSNLSQIERALAGIRHQAASKLVIAGGDGTLQGAVSWLARHVPPDSMPQLILLSAGRTNYVAEDIGTRSHFLETLDTVLSRKPDQLHPVDRPTLKLEHPSIAEQHGFFLAGAMLDEVIRYVHRWQASRNTWLHRRHMASSAGVVSLALKRAFGRYRFELPRLGIEAEGLGREDAACRFLLMSTLNHDRSFVDPYAARGKGPLRITAVRAGAQRLTWRLLKLALGRFSENMTAENGYISGRCINVVIRNLETLVLDGQEFDLDPSEPLRISAGPIFRFLRP